MRTSTRRITGKTTVYSDNGTIYYGYEVRINGIKEVVMRHYTHKENARGDLQNELAILRSRLPKLQDGVCSVCGVAFAGGCNCEPYKNPPKVK